MSAHSLCTLARRLIAAGLLAGSLVGCGNSGGLSACNVQPDVTGSWKFSLQPLTEPHGAATLPRSDGLAVDLIQIQRTGFLKLGNGIWGSLVSSDKGFFDTVTIPPLKQNNGSKTGAEVGCTVKINVPIASPVSDDDVDQGPLRIALSGNIVARGVMQGDSTSQLIMLEDQAMIPRLFLWSGAQP